MKKIRTGRTPPIVFVWIVGIILVLVVLALTLSSNTGGITSLATQSNDHSAPEPVNQRVISALQNNDFDSIYGELSPSLQQSITPNALQLAESDTVNQLGEIIKVEILENPTILMDVGWDGQWAQSKIRITRERASEIYVVRYFLENGRWYLVVTIKVE
jgi:hypothetical protein